MSSALLPSRAQCIHITDNVQRCQCSCFVPTLLEPNICGRCGHGIHTHVDYVSMVVNHYPPTQCVAYVQKTALVQRCTCEAQLCDHVVIDNPYRIAEPWNVLDNFLGNNDASQSVDAISFSNDVVNGTFTPSANSDTDTFYHDANLTSITAAPTFSSSHRHAFSPYNDAGNIPLAPYMSSPSASNTPAGIQLGVAQVQAYSSDHYFVQYPGHSVNNPYPCQLDGDAAGENIEYHYYSPKTMHGATPDAGSDSSI
ncbi:uncharacterized protein EV420DRAFT_355136 [Desarmillaria tabescens]|uniref:Uncharacterized protein n=1 Tax=Armillaria tabescens TaxID=1929756 RepID=A0AA39KCS1_ARMTA|nr:uncharacterized protein EV420DRAFT_355136 [Desarmillaria tabescens]KAK0458423.1 hypothetical protein EV420DRAFT_355136 [Desarmillaria tabescens]